MSLKNFWGGILYETLGVSEDADYAQIKKTFDEEYRKYVSASASKKLKARFRYDKVLDAWECLKDPIKREEYDSRLRKA